MKQNSNNSDLETRYQRFDRLVIILIYLMLAPVLLCGIIFVLAKTDKTRLIFGILFLVVTAVDFIIARQIAKRRTKYLNLLREERANIVRTGIFKDIYDEYKHDGFEFNLRFDKLLFAEYHNNAIDLSLQKNNHEFAIVIDETAISIIANEETDSPIEIEVPLTKFETIEQVYAFINDFINTHS